MISAATSDSAIIILAPIIASLVAVYFFYRRKHTSRSTRKYMLLATGFVFLAVFFVVVPDPEFVQTMFIEKGDYVTPIFWSIIAAIFLFVVITVFKKHEES